MTYITAGVDPVKLIINDCLEVANVVLLLEQGRQSVVRVHSLLFLGVLPLLVEWEPPTVFGLHETAGDVDLQILIRLEDVARMDPVQFLHNRTARVLSFLHDILVQLTEVCIDIAFTLGSADFPSFGGRTTCLVHVLMSHLRHYYIFVDVLWHLLRRFWDKFVRIGVYG